jgi:glycosyltransferase involved in cell wall biosynthesis
VRVLITVPWCERLGGAEALLQTILDGVQEGGHELELVFFDDGPWPAELIRAGLRVEVVNAGRLRQAHRWGATVIRLMSIFRDRQPDLIVNWAQKTHLYAAPAAMLSGMADRVVWWQHSIARRTLLECCANLLPARAIVCDSQAAARAQARLWPRRRTVVIAPGTAPAPCRSQLASLELPPGVAVVGIVGRLQPWKGQDRVLLAQKILRDRGYDVHLLIVGGDAYGLSPEYAASLPSLVKRLGLQDAVTMTGEVLDAMPYIGHMDILVNASEPEPFGIVLLEGMACAVPVVAVDAGGPPDFIEHEKTGMLARSGEPQALADALEPLLRSPALRHALGGAGHERFMCQYTDVAVRRRFFTSLEEINRADWGLDADAVRC